MKYVVVVMLFVILGVIVRPEPEARGAALTTWQPLDVQNGWQPVAGFPAEYRVGQDGLVVFRGAVEGGDLKLPMALIPATACPTIPQVFPVMSLINHGTVFVKQRPPVPGTACYLAVLAGSTSRIHLDGILYYADPSEAQDRALR